MYFCVMQGCPADVSDEGQRQELVQKVGIIHNFDAL